MSIYVDKMHWNIHLSPSKLYKTIFCCHVNYFLLDIREPLTSRGPKMGLLWLVRTSGSMSLLHTPDNLLEVYQEPEVYYLERQNIVWPDEDTRRMWHFTFTPTRLQQ
jgi:hypothetical protein